MRLHVMLFFVGLVHSTGTSILFHLRSFGTGGFRMLILFLLRPEINGIPLLIQTTGTLKETVEETVFDTLVAGNLAKK